MTSIQAPVSTTPAPFQSASLYVGDLHNEVTESLLFELFNRVGPVASIRVCRDSVTRRSLGYAYVNFHNVQDAERALDTMNFTDIKSKPCRIMWSQRDPSLRKSGVGNVFVRSLAPSVDNKGLYDTFSVFGNILSCKVATDDNGVSKGYGYVHFETAEAAQDAIQKFNGTLIDDVEVHVGSFVRLQDRAGQNDWTNLYVKHFPQFWDEAKIKEVFSVYGTVANVAISRDQDGRSRAFGFVNYAEHESAVKALADLSGKTFSLPAPAAEEPVAEDENGEALAVPPQTFELYVSRAQKKSERVREMKQRMDLMNHEKLSRYQGMNLYVKNIGDTITDEQFRESFSAFGTITSARIMRESTDLKTSKGFGFVCYSSPEEATRAVTEMNGKVVGSKPLVVTLHQRKEHRRALLASTYAPQNMNMGMRFPPGGMGMGMNPAMGMPQPYMYMQGPGQPGQQGYPNQQRGGPGMGPGMGGPQYPYGPMVRGGPGGRGAGGPGSPRNMFPGGPGGGVGQPGFYGGGAPQNYYQQGLPQGQGPQQGIPLQQQQQQQQGGFKGRGGPLGGGAPGGYPVSGGMSPTQGQQQGVLQQQQQGRRPMTGAPGQGPQVGGPGPLGVGRGQQQQQQVMGGLQQQQRGVYQGPGPALGQQQPTQQQLLQQRGQVQGGMGVKFNNQARNQNGPLPMQQQPNMGMMQQQQIMLQQQPQLKQEFSDIMLASADPVTQKNMIGERLYPLIHSHQPEQAGKITGMLLEMDNGELLNLIESPDALLSKIDEALVVLRNHKIGSDE